MAIKKKGQVAQTKSKKKYFFRNAARNLQNFTLGRNSVGSMIKNDLYNGRPGSGFDPDRRNY